ncbi:low molecular weight protein tyrosine phosphatase family protein [Nannocystaceae bacterium ST9]
MPRLKVLFICSRNQWRSPTAERIFSGRRDIEVRSRGLSRTARRKLAAADVSWAELIFVMEDEHRERLVEGFRDALADTPVHVLDIPDEYPLMDPGLIELLRQGVEPVLEGIERTQPSP